MEWFRLFYFPAMARLGRSSKHVAVAGSWQEDAVMNSFAGMLLVLVLMRHQIKEAMK